MYRRLKAVARHGLPLLRWVLLGLAALTTLLSYTHTRVSTSIPVSAINPTQHGYFHVNLNAFKVQAPVWVRLSLPFGDSPAAPNTSTMRVHADGLKLSRSPPLDLAQKGNSPGVFSHWGNDIVFKLDASLPKIERLAIDWRLIGPNLQFPALLLLILTLMTFRAIALPAAWAIDSGARLLAAQWQWSSDWAKSKTDAGSRSEWPTIAASIFHALRWPAIGLATAVLVLSFVRISANIPVREISVTPTGEHHVNLDAWKRRISYVTRVLVPAGDSNEYANHSTLRVWLNGQSVVRSPPLTIAEAGQGPGVYSHWSNSLVFKIKPPMTEVKQLQVSWLAVHPNLRLPALFLLLLFSLAFDSVRAFIRSRAEVTNHFFQTRIAWVVGAQIALYAIAYNAMLPPSMYLAPDSLAYLSVNPVVPPAYPLVVRGLVKLELLFGAERIVLLRYLAIALYSLGGYLIARAFWRSNHGVAALLVLPAIWSINSLTMYLNFVLTEAVATSLMLIACGAYANAVASQHQADERGADRWFAGFIIFGMLAFMSRPAFLFILIALPMLSLAVSIRSRRRMAMAAIGMTALFGTHYLLAHAIHGRLQSQLGYVLIALVFDLPANGACKSQASDPCRVETAMQPFVSKLNESKTSYERYTFKAANNTYVTNDAVAAITGADKNGVLTELSIAKITANPWAYAQMVLTNSVHSIAANYGQYRYDYYGRHLHEFIGATNENAPRLRPEAKLNMEPRINKIPEPAAYRNFLFQGFAEVFNPNWFPSIALPMYVAAILLCFLPLFCRLSVPASLIACFAMLTVGGITFQNMMFPVIGRLVAPFQPLFALALVGLLAIAYSFLRGPLHRLLAIEMPTARVIDVHRPAVARSAEAGRPQRLPDEWPPWATAVITGIDARIVRPSSAGLARFRRRAGTAGSVIIGGFILGATKVIAGGAAAAANGRRHVASGLAKTIDVGKAQVSRGTAFGRSMLSRPLGGGPDYRPDIDGLRAVAVGSVVLGHAHVPGFSGGFVGVDVFFVISGYLITRLIAAELDAGTFTFKDFWLRRARRILPALLVVLIASSIAATIMLFPPDLVSYARSLLAQVFFASNFVFWSEVGYFDGPADMKPLLHTWSLAIEEQFYLLFPLALWWLTVHRLPARRVIIIGAATASLAFATWATVRYPTMAFYLLPPRAWELLLGAVIALSPALRPGWRAESAGAAGLALIGTAVALFTAKTPFPGAAALLPCGGAALLIWSGSDRQTWAARLLSLRPLVFLGLISYALYLWHWPLLAFARYRAEIELTPVEAMLWLLLAVLLAVLSWWFVERPIRTRHYFPVPWRFVRTAGASLAGVGIIAVSLHGIGQALPSRLGPEYAKHLVTEARGWSHRQERCHNQSQHDPKSPEPCRLGPGDSSRTPELMVWGDSHAAAWFPAFDALAEETGVVALHVSLDACPPIVDVDLTPQHNCRRSNERVLARIVEQRMRTVILVGRWSHYIPYGAKAQFSAHFVVDGRQIRDPMEAAVILERQLAATVTRLTEAGVKVWIVRGVPELNFGGPYARPARLSGYVRVGTQPLDDHIRQQKFALPILDRLKGTTAGVLDPASLLCTNGQCERRRGPYSLYRDDNHLSHFGAMEMRPMLRPIFDAIRASR